MTRTYRGPCDELYGCEIEYPDHDCNEHMREREERVLCYLGDEFNSQWWETEEWLECAICGQPE